MVDEVQQRQQVMKMLSIHFAAAPNDSGRHFAVAPLGESRSAGKTIRRSNQPEAILSLSEVNILLDQDTQGLPIPHPPFFCQALSTAVKQSDSTHSHCKQWLFQETSNPKAPGKVTPAYVRRNSVLQLCGVEASLRLLPRY